MIETQAYLNKELFYKNLIGNGKKVSDLDCLTNNSNKTNKIEMTFGEIASKLLLAYYMGKLNEDENDLNKIVTMNNKELTKNLVDKGQLIDWD